MQKISWFRRLFMNWNDFVNYFSLEKGEIVREMEKYKILFEQLEKNKESLKVQIEILQKEKTEWKTKYEVIQIEKQENNNLLIQKNNEILGFKKDISDQREMFQKANDSLHQKKIDIENLKTKIDDFKKNIYEIKLSLNNEINNQKNSHKFEIQNLKDKLERYEDKYHELKNQEETKELKLESFVKEMGMKKNEIIKLRTLLDSTKENSRLLENEIKNKLQTIGKIDRTFFGTSGNKGKGMLGEKQLEKQLEKIDINQEYWTKNLQVGKNDVVEFAIKTNIDGQKKWIPIDSKVLEVEFDEDNHIIVNDKYKDKVLQQAKKVSKYLNKTVTSGYGLLVIQNDDIYMELFDKYPNLFSETIQNYKIYILSPSSFIQFAWSLTNILNIYKKVHKEEAIYNKIVDINNSIVNFYSNIATAYKTLKIGFEKHLPIIKRKFEEITKVYNNEDNKKIKVLKETDLIKIKES